MKAKKAWVAWINSDLTEGRGQQIPYCVCESETTCRRLSKGKDTQGTDPWQVKEVELYYTEHGWFGPVRIVGSTKEDDKKDKELAYRREVLERARAAGLSDEDVAAIKSWGV